MTIAYFIRFAYFLLNSKTRAFHTDGHREPLLHLGFGFINRHIDAVETRVGARKDFDVTVTVQREFANAAVVTLEMGETLNRHTTGACGGGKRIESN